jgi:hypothetical protein
MHQRVRCPECHRWTDALLVWAAGDCCPACNSPIASFDRSERPVVEESDGERLVRPPGRLSQSRLIRARSERLGELPYERP